MKRYTAQMFRAVVLLAFAVLACAQDPYVMLPRNYKLETENEWVRISRVHNEPGDELPTHSHPSIPTIYVYLTDGGPIRFDHTGGVIIERPAVKAGSVRFNRNAQAETHNTKYLGTAPAEYLRIELKTKPGPPHRDARLRGDADFPWEDEQVRIRRLRGIPEKPTRPAVVVTDRGYTWFDSKDAASLDVSHDAHWAVVVELKTEPAR